MDSFERAGFVFDVRDAGPPDGEVVVLLHGFPQDSGAWGEVAAHLNRAGYRTLAPDMRGVSPGARPEAVRQCTAIESVRDVAAMLDAAGAQQAHIVGHDWGGHIAWAIAAELPDQVRSLTVVSTPHPIAFRKSLTSSLQGVRSWYMALFQLPWLPEQLLAPGTPMWSALVRGLPQEHRDRYARRLSDAQARTAALIWYRVMRYELREPSYRSGPITAPTTYVWRMYDPALGRAPAEATGRYVAGPYTFVELRAGHWIPETRPEILAELVQQRAESAVA